MWRCHDARVGGGGRTDIKGGAVVIPCMHGRVMGGGRTMVDSGAVLVELGVVVVVRWVNYGRWLHSGGTSKRECLNKLFI